MKVTIEYKLYEIRTAKGMSIRKLAELSGVSKTTINDIENNRHDPTLYTLCMIAAALQVAPEQIYKYTIVSDISDK